MDWNLIFGSYPYIGQLIFEHLDERPLEECRFIDPTWGQFLTNSKFFWAKLTKGYPGWNTLLTSPLVDSDALREIGFGFLVLKKDISRSESLANNLHPIFCCIYVDQVRIFKILIQIWPSFKDLKYNNCDLDLELDERMLNPYIFAVCNDSIEMIKYFLKEIENGLEFPNDDPNKKSPMHWASMYGNFEALKLLISKIQGEKNPKDLEGRTPLHLASMYGTVKLVQLLLDNIPGDKNPAAFLQAWTPLHFAVKFRNAEIAKLLLTKIEGDKNPTDHFGCTPLHFACENGQIRVVKMLLENINGDKNPRDRRSGWTPLHAASRSGHYEIVKLLIDNMEGEKNPNDYNASTPLHGASRIGNLKIAELLISKIRRYRNPGADICLMDHNGMTPLHWAASKGHFELYKLFLSSNLDDPNLLGPNPDNMKGVTPLHLAARNNQLKIVKIILFNIKGEKNPKALNGSTPLHGASKNGHFEVVKTLLKSMNREDLNPCDKNGDTPLHLASKFGHIEIAKLLLDHVVNPRDAKGNTPFDVAKSAEMQSLFKLSHHEKKKKI